MKEAKTHLFLSYAKKFFLGTAFSRVMGMFRDMSMAAVFGASSHIALFMVAYRFIYLFRRLFGESTLQASFIPFFEGYRLENPRKSALFFRDSFWSIVLFISFIVILFGLGISFFSDPLFKNLLWLSPGIIFIVLFALSSSHLFCEHSYVRPAIAPAVFNIVWIGAVWILPKENAIFYLSCALIFAFFMQWIVVGQKSFSYVFSHIQREFFRPKLFSPDVKKLLQPVSFVFLGVAATQLNSLIDSFFALYADASGPAYLWYAIRWQQLPISLIAVTLSGASLPSLSRAIQSQNYDQAKEIFEKAFKTAIFLTLIAFFGLLAFGGTGLNFVYGRGAFTSVDLVMTLRCLWGYLLGLFPMTALILLTARSQAEKNYTLPMKASFACVLSNISLNTLFVFGFSMKAESIALATSISACVQCLFYTQWIKELISSTRAYSVIRWVILSSISMGITLYLGEKFFEDPTLKILKTGQGTFLRGTAYQIKTVFSMIGIYMSSIILFVYLQKIRNEYFKKA